MNHFTIKPRQQHKARAAHVTRHPSGITCHPRPVIHNRSLIILYTSFISHRSLSVTCDASLLTRYTSFISHRLLSVTCDPSLLTCYTHCQPHSSPVTCDPSLDTRDQ
ncbi:hypothetical protein PoB_002176700 [Plakobranchus ocellatus]|uniref:Uncharacterized protein n=1 Tax=Plakobranchus ocellatus TaxID=259542 RepID=A0AAV3ZKZ8_9GAST|nr:hypothetical protein PoB_002176700 [Plakobranchus ocellatus]